MSGIDTLQVQSTEIYKKNPEESHLVNSKLIYSEINILYWATPIKDMISDSGLSKRGQI